jgi:hypothetical protein
MYTAEVGTFIFETALLIAFKLAVTSVRQGARNDGKATI